MTDSSTLEQDVDFCFVGDGLGVRFDGSLLVPEVVKYLFGFYVFQRNPVSPLLFGSRWRPLAFPGYFDFSLELGFFRLHIFSQLVIGPVELNQVECSLVLKFHFHPLDITLYGFGPNVIFLVVLVLGFLL